MSTNLLVEQELFVLPEHQSASPVLSGVLVAQSVLCVVYCNSFLVLLYFLMWSLYCLSLDLRLLITPLVSSSLSHLFVLLSFFFWQLHCLPFLNLRLLITPLVSSNLSHLFVLLPFFFWPLHYLPFLSLRFLITPLVSSNFSYPCKTTYF